MSAQARRPATAIELHTAPVLAGLPDQVVAALAASAEIVRLPADTTLIREGDRPRSLFVLMKGLAELYTAADEREPALAIVWPPETLIPAAALTDKPYLVSVRTLAPSAILCLDCSQVRAAARQHAELAFRLATILCGQFRMVQRGWKEMRLRDAPHRLACFLYRLIEAHGEHGCADLPIPKHRIAARLGMAPESVSRALGTLEDHGLKVRGSRAIIMDRSRLQRFCTPDPLLDGVEQSLLATAL